MKRQEITVTIDQDGQATFWMQRGVEAVDKVTVVAHSLGQVFAQTAAGHGDGVQMQQGR